MRKNKKTKLTTKMVEDLFYIVGCALNNTRLDIERASSIDWSIMYKLARFNGIESLLCYAIEPVLNQINIDSEIVQAWQDRKRYTILKNAQLDMGRRELFSAMEEAGCWHLPLKGVILKDMYPAAGMRQMSDNDILFDENFRHWVHDWFVEHDYEVEVFNTSYDDVYVKGYTRCYEMHVSLVGSDEKLWWPYYKDVFSRLNRVEGTECEYRFADEDFYIYIILHAFKHYRSAGTGVRILFDCYVYLKEKKYRMNWEYINKETAKLGIDEFEVTIRNVSEKIFDLGGIGLDNSLTPSQVKMLKYIVTSGTYGTEANRIKNGVENNSGDKISWAGKIKFLISRIFLPVEIMYMHHPICRKYHWLLPVFYIKRIFKGLFQKRIYKEVGAVVEVKE